MKIILLLLFFTNFTFSAETIENELSEKHKFIKGTKLAIIPPKGFTPSNNFTGFEHKDSYSSIMLNEIPTKIDNIVTTITPNALANQGVELIKIDTIKINDLKGIMVEGTQIAYGQKFRKYILIVGNDKNTLMLNGAFPDSNAIGKEIRSSMFSMYYDSEKKVDPLEGVKFSIDVTNTKFKFANMMSGTVIYTVDGLVPPQSNDKTMLMASNSDGAGNSEQRKEFAIMRMQNLPVKTFVKNDLIKEVKINGMPGYEILSYPDLAMDINDFTYMVMLFDETSYYLIIGIAVDELDSNLELFRSIANTFKLKNEGE